MKKVHLQAESLQPRTSCGLGHMSRDFEVTEDLRLVTCESCKLSRDYRFSSRTVPGLDKGK